MESLRYFAINLGIEIAKTKNIFALEDLFSALSQALEEEDFEQVLTEIAEHLSKHHLPIFNWFTETLAEAAQALEELEDLEEDEEEDVVYLTKEDLIHLMLDEGFLAEQDFSDRGEKVAISKKARLFLEEHYDLEGIDFMICSLRGRRKKNIE